MVFNPASEKVMERGLVLPDVSSNNEVEYAALLKGLEWYVSNDINRLNIYGDSMLIINRAFSLVKVISLHQILERSKVFSGR